MIYLYVAGAVAALIPLTIVGIRIMSAIDTLNAAVAANTAAVNAAVAKINADAAAASAGDQPILDAASTIAANTAALEAVAPVSA